MAQCGGGGVNMDTFFSACRLWNSLEYLERYGYDFCWNDQSNLIWSMRCGSFALSYTSLLDYLDRESKAHFDEYYYGLILKKINFLRKNNFNFNITNIPVPKVCFLCQLIDKIARVLLKKFEQLKKPKLPARANPPVRSYKPTGYITYPVPSEVIIVPFKYATLEEALTIERTPRPVQDEDAAVGKNIATPGILQEIQFAINRAIRFVFLKEALDEKRAKQKKMLDANIELEEKLDGIASAAARRSQAHSQPDDQTNAFINELVKKYEAEFGIGAYALTSTESSESLLKCQRSDFRAVKFEDDEEEQKTPSLVADIPEDTPQVPTMDTSEIPQFVDDILAEAYSAFKATSLEERDRRQKRLRAASARRAKAQQQKINPNQSCVSDSFAASRLSPSDHNPAQSPASEHGQSESQPGVSNAGTCPSEISNELASFECKCSINYVLLATGQENVPSPSPESSEASADDELPYASNMVNKQAVLYDDLPHSSKSCSSKPRDIEDKPSCSKYPADCHDDWCSTSDICQLAEEVAREQNPPHLQENFDAIVAQIVEETKNSCSADDKQVVDQLVAKLAGKHRHINVMPSFKLNLVPDILKHNMIATREETGLGEEDSTEFADLLKNILEGISAQEDKYNLFSSDSGSEGLKQAKQATESGLEEQPDAATQPINPDDWAAVEDHTSRFAKILYTFFTPADPTSPQAGGTNQVELQGMQSELNEQVDSGILDYIKALVSGLPVVGTGCHFRSAGAEVDADADGEAAAGATPKRRSSGGNSKRRQKRRRRHQDF